MKHEGDEDDEEDDPDPVGAVMDLLVVVGWSIRLLGWSKGDVGVGCDDVGNLLDTGLDAGAVLSLDEIIVHAAADVADFGVVEDALETIANLDTIFVILDGEDHEDALVGGLGADLPLVLEGGGEGVDVLTVEGFDGDYFDGGVGLGVDLPGELLDVFFGSRVDDAGEIGNVAGGFGELVGRFGAGKGSGEDAEQK